MKVSSVIAGLIGVLVAPVTQVQAGADTGLADEHSVDARSATRDRLAQALAKIETVYETTEEQGDIRRRNIWSVGEVLPWRTVLQPSCLRVNSYELEQIPEPWPVLADAPSLRALLLDEEPGIRALAAEALATLHQPEDMPRLAALVADASEAGMELVAPGRGQFARPEDFVGPGPDAVTNHTWRKSSVANHAAWGMNLMLGSCCPQVIVDLEFTRFGAFGRDRSLDAIRTAPSLVASLADGDPEDHLWYWQEYIHRALHEIEDNLEHELRTDVPGFDTLDWSQRSKLMADERSRAKKAWIKAFFEGMRDWPAERRAMVRLLVSNVHQGGADMGYYDMPDHLLFNVPLNLGLEKRRILELLDGIRLWPDANTIQGGQSQVVERLAMGWRECFDPDDVPRLLARFSSSNDDLWWSARAALVVAISNLMPANGLASDDPDTAEGFLRGTLKDDRDAFVKARAAAELLRMDPDVHWPFVMDQCFADRDNNDYLMTQTLRWLAKAPVGDGSTEKLVELVTDEQFRPLWLEPQRSMGKGTQGGWCRRMASQSLKTRVGYAVVTDDDLKALNDPDQREERLQQILVRVHAIESE